MWNCGYLQPVLLELPALDGGQAGLCIVHTELDWLSSVLVSTVSLCAPPIP